MQLYLQKIKSKFLVVKFLTRVIILLLDFYYSEE